MIKAYSTALSIPATTSTELSIVTHIVPEGKKWQAQEIGFTVLTGCSVYVYVQNERVLTFLATAVTDVRRLVLNWDLPQGFKIQVTAVNSSGSAAICGVNIVVDEVTA